VKEHQKEKVATLILEKASSRNTQGNGIRSCHSRISGPRETASLVLFLLDVARATPNTGFLGLAKDSAEHLTSEWRDFFRRESDFRDISVAEGLSNSAFVLAEVWKATRNPVYRETGLQIIHYISEIESRYVETVRLEGRR
jgi:hypothetical protein